MGQVFGKRPRVVVDDVVDQDRPVKRPAIAPDAFLRVLGSSEGLTNVLRFTGASSVLALETLSTRAREMIRRGSIEFESSMDERYRASIYAYRHELFAIRRAGGFESGDAKLRKICTYDFHGFSELSGDVWYGAGFYAQSMQDAPYAIIIDGNGKVSERRLENHAAGDELPSSVTVQSNTITAVSLRTVIVTRGAQGMSKEHASFSLQDLTVPFITAIGSTVDLSYHQNKTASSVSMWPTTPEPVCMCEQPAAAFGSAVGNIKYLPTGEEFGFVNYCLPEPRETVLAQRNPTCDVRAYAGGLQICKHMWSLLDSDQEQPWPDQPLVYYQKYRFYFQAYQSPSILF